MRRAIDTTGILHTPDRARFWAWGLAGVAIASTVYLGCETQEAHAFGAYRYVIEDDCLEEPAAVDVIDGPDPGPCDELKCWTSPGRETYVTTTACSAPVGYEDATDDPTGSACASALDAFARGDEGRCEP